MTSDVSRAIPETCFRCGSELRPGDGTSYLIKIEAMADPAPPVITSEDLAEPGLERKIANLLEDMKGLSAQEAMDQVYRRVSFYLCGSCYRLWIENPVG
jgi:hypothetical protein